MRRSRILYTTIFWFAGLWLGTSPAAWGQTTTFQAGSLIIPMDTTYQDQGMLKAYGLLYRLLQANVPVHWVIKNNKNRGDVDFTASAVNIQTNAVITAHGYRGGPFVIDLADVPLAIPILTTWHTTHTTTLHRTTASFQGYVAKRLTAAPTIAVFQDGTELVAFNALNAAAIPDGQGQPWPTKKNSGGYPNHPDVLTPASVVGTTSTSHTDGSLFRSSGLPKYCQLAVMHWGVNEVIPAAIAEMRAFLLHPTHLFAQCQAVNAIENSPQGRFLTPKGFLIDNTISSLSFLNQFLPFTQMDGPFTVVGGSERAYSLPAGDSYYSTDVVMIKDGTTLGIRDVYMTGYIDGRCAITDPTCTAGVGKITYLGGHEYSTTLPISTNAATQGVRLFLNSLFEADCASPKGQPKLSLQKTGPAETINDTVTYTLAYANTGTGSAANFTLQDTLPTGSTYVSSSNGGVLTGSIVTWNLPDLGPNQSGSVTLTVRFPAFGVYTNQFRASWKIGANTQTLQSNLLRTSYQICLTAATRPCYTGTQGCARSGSTYTCQGVCKTGLETCTGGTWGVCQGEILPSAERCDNLDNNCNGQIDEAFPTKGQSCTSGLGACQRSGIFVCSADGSGVSCNATPGPPTAETCDGIDNNCNGQIDEGCQCQNGQTRPCYSSATGCTPSSGTFSCTTPCRAGLQTCALGLWGACVGEILPSAELCDGQDNNCNGQIDEGFPKGQSCTSGLGACQRSGTFVCNAAQTGVTCNATPGSPTAELCDGIDNNCNGQIDENFATKGQPCTSGLGNCRASGTFVCNAAQTGVVCNATPGPPSIETCNSQDDDCDGRIDETFSTKGQPCTAGIGPCQRSGIFVCRPDASGVVCNATPATPALERCDGIDNDCDGQIDEDFPNKGQACTSGLGECQRSGTFVCDPTGSDLLCDAIPGSPSAEICDSKDNNCDGQIDEGCQCQNGQTRPCYSGLTGCTRSGGTYLCTGLCKAGTQTCSAGLWGACAGEITPIAEICDGKDNNCDGQTDEAFPTQGQPCTSGLGECRRSGVIACDADETGVSCNAIPGPPRPEVCDGKDNNCDGRIDEAFPTQGQPCTSGLGECQRSGVLVCSSDGSSVSCNATPGLPQAEVCDNKDNNCDGQTDEGGVCKTKTPPQIVGVPATSILGGNGYIYAPRVTDNDPNDTHTWSLTKAPLGATIDPATGRITWPTTAADIGKEFEFEVKVCDQSGLCASQTWKVRVTDPTQPPPDKPPQIVGTPATTANPSKSYTFSPSLLDPIPTETYTWKTNTAPPGATIDPATGQIQWTPSPADVGKTFDFEIEVCDSKGRCAKRRWQVLVTNDLVNTPPLITSTPPTTAQEATSYQYRPTVSDPDAGDTHTWKLKNAPPGATIDPATGQIQWTPSPADVGKDISFTLEVCDKVGRCDEQTWTVRPSAQNQPPAFTSQPPTEAYVGKPVEYAPTITDPDAGDKHTWKLTKAPPGATIDPVTGKVSWTPSSSDADTPATFEIEVCDNATPPHCVTQTFQITPRRPCQVDLDCPSPQICTSDTTGILICTPEGCASKTPPCPQANELCQNGSCKQNPCDSSTCTLPSICRPSDGKCILPCAGVSCPPASRCVDGACVPEPCATAGKNCAPDEICSSTDPVNPVCVKNPCSLSSCRHGRVCSPQGVCQDDPCALLTCPDPTKAFCQNGQCIERPPCQIDLQCPDTDVCIQGRCQSALCYTDPALCKAKSVCLATLCKDDLCPTPQGQACKANEFCRKGDGSCTASCASIQCPQGKRCQGGSCQDDPCVSVSCKSGEICVQGDCKIDHCSSTAGPCKHGRICSRRLNGCTDDPCKDVQCPTQGEVCAEGDCILPSCRFDSDCQATGLCIGQRCITPRCLSKADCGADELCIDGACRADSCKGITCPASLFCRGGICKDSCAGVTCPQGQICQDKLCQADPCSAVTCQADEICLNGKCAKDLCKAVADPCKSGRICVVDQCTQDPCANLQCPQGQTCLKGQCTGVLACKVDVECPSDGVCLSGQCAAPGCYKAAACQQAELCLKAACQANPCPQKTCAAQTVCRPSDGVCVALCPRCSQGSLCKDGRCESDPCSTVTCKSGETCDQGLCQADLCASQTPSCRYGRVCLKNACHDDPCFGITCPADHLCKDGSCQNTKPSEEPSSEATTEITPEDASSSEGEATAGDPSAGDKAVGDKLVGDSATSENSRVQMISGGCGCSSIPASAPFAFLGLLVFLFVLRRRRGSPTCESRRFENAA